MEEETGRHRKNDIVLWLLLCVLTITIILQYKRNTKNEQEYVIEQNPINYKIEDRINPNTAPWYSLARLPGIGPTKAKDIVRYREENQGNDKRRDVFKTPDDLMKIKGIGPATVAKIKKYLQMK